MNTATKLLPRLGKQLMNWDTRKLITLHKNLKTSDTKENRKIAPNKETSNKKKIWEVREKQKGMKRVIQTNNHLHGYVEDTWKVK